MSTGNMKVDFGALDGAASDIKSSGNQIQNRLDTLSHDLQPLQSDWTGNAQQAYQQAKSKWDQAAADMNQLLLQFGDAVSQSNSDYNGAESKNTSLFG